MNSTRIPIVLIVLCLFTSYCSNKKEKVKEKNDGTGKLYPTENVYDDYDPFTLEGTRVKNNTSYPYIQIADIDSTTKKITFARSEANTTERTYKKENGYWTTYYDYPMDTGM